MNIKKFTSLILSVLLLIAALAPALSAHAADNVTVTLVYTDGEKISPFFELSVEDGTAESYGLPAAEKDHADKPVETVSVLDVIAQAHSVLYGEAFTSETAEQYLSFSYGFATRMFGQNGNFCFAVNDETPHDDVLITSNWGNYYTGYMLDTARVQNGDVITAYMIQDTSFWSDIYPLFSESEYSAVSSEMFSVTVNGYNMAMYGCNEQSLIDSVTEPLEGAGLYLTKDFENMTQIGTLDENGSASVSIAETGTWYLVVKGLEEDTPVCPMFRKVTVTEAPNPTEDTRLNVPSSETVGYRSNVIVTASADELPEGYAIALYEEDTLLTKGEENSVSYYFKQIKAGKVLTAKIIDADGSVQQNSDGALEKTIEINVKTGFFAKVKAFFLGLFKMLPTVELKP